MLLPGALLNTLLFLSGAGSLIAPLLLLIILTRPLLLLSLLFLIVLILSLLLLSLLFLIVLILPLLLLSLLRFWLGLLLLALLLFGTVLLFVLLILLSISRSGDSEKQRQNGCAREFNYFHSCRLLYC
jgi:hypothetical protein